MNLMQQLSQPWLLLESPACHSEGFAEARRTVLDTCCGFGLVIAVGVAMEESVRFGRRAVGK